MSWTPTWPEKNPLNGLHAALAWIAPLFIMAMGQYGGKATVNHGTDGTHSDHSAHYKGQAVDINHRDLHFPWATDSLGRAWFSALFLFAGQLIMLANRLARMVDSPIQYYLVLEASHLHLEITLAGEAPNIVGWEKGKFMYATEDVKTIMTKGGDINGS